VGQKPFFGLGFDFGSGSDFGLDCGFGSDFDEAGLSCFGGSGLVSSRLGSGRDAGVRAGAVERPELRRREAGRDDPEPLVPRSRARARSAVDALPKLFAGPRGGVGPVVFGRGSS
jgi:hypothetical protein